MNLVDVIFYGWYQVLDKTIYEYGNRNGSMGPKEHSWFITFFLHGINIWTVISYLSARFLAASVSHYFSLSIAILVLFAGYRIYIKKGRALAIINRRVTPGKVIFSVIVAIVYSTVSIYLLFVVGDYVRFRLLAK